MLLPVKAGEVPPGSLNGAPSLTTEEREVRFYRFAGTFAEVVVEEAYARELDLLRAERLAAESDASAKEPVGQAAHAEPHLALPEDFLPALERLPSEDMRLNIVLLGWPHPCPDVATGSATNTIAISPSAGAAFCFRLTTDLRSLFRFVVPWAYAVVQLSDIEHHEKRWYKRLGVMLEPGTGGFPGGTSVEDREDDHWAWDFGEALFATRSADFRRYTENFPIRSLLFGRVLRKHLTQAELFPGLTFAPMHERTLYIEQVIAPRAFAKLSDCVRMNRDERAAKLLVLLGHGADLARIPLDAELSLRFACESIGEREVETIRAVPWLAELDLSNTDFGQGSMTFTWEGFPSLRKLDLSGCRIHDWSSFLPKLGSLPVLESLSLRYTKVGDYCLSLLALRDGLRYLDVRGTQVTAEGVERFRHSLPQCRIVAFGEGSGDDT
jgi:hypothetical protein